MLDLPPIAEWPLFQVDVLKSPLLHLLHSPFGCELVIAAIGDARTVHLGHPKEVLHYLRVLEGFGLDLRQGVQIDFVTSCCLREGSRDEEEGRNHRGSLPEAEYIHGDSHFLRMWHPLNGVRRSSPGLGTSSHFRTLKFNWPSSPLIGSSARLVQTALGTFCLQIGR